MKLGKQTQGPAEAAKDQQVARSKGGSWRVYSHGQTY